MENNITSIQEDSITITKPAEEITLERSEINDKINFLTDDIANLEAALAGRKADLIYYNSLLSELQ